MANEIKIAIPDIPTDLDPPALYEVLLAMKEILEQLMEATT